MAKHDYSVRLGVKADFHALLTENHYLSIKEKRGYRMGINVVLQHNEDVVGVAIFTGFPVPELCVGLYGIPRTEQAGLYELSRLCLDPTHQNAEHNLATWFLARAISLLRKTTSVRALLSYADCSYHEGTVYKAYGFKYYGLTAEKKDWKPFASSIPASRGCKGEGEWVPRSRKHRFLITYDKKLTPKWVEQPYTKGVL